MKAISLVLVALWLSAGLLAWRKRRGLAVALLALSAAPIFVLALLPLVRIVVDREQYVDQLGEAALADLPSTAAVCGLSLLAILAAIASLRRSGKLFAAGWLALAPVVVFVFYLAFVFRIF